MTKYCNWIGVKTREASHSNHRLFKYYFQRGESFQVTHDSTFDTWQTMVFTKLSNPLWKIVLPQPRMSFHIDKTNSFFFFFKKLICLLFLKLLYFPRSTMICHMSNEIIQSVTYHNHDDFQHVQLHIFTKNCFTILRII